MAASAFHYDGSTARRHAVTVSWDGTTLHLIEPAERIDPAQLVPLGDRSRFLFGLQGREGWRLGFDEPPPPEIAARLPRQEHHGGLLDRIGILPALIICGILAAAAAIGAWQGSALVARLVPERWEVAFGDTLAGDLGGNACTAAPGQSALAALTARLSGGRAMRVRVVDLDIVNAATLPGRQIVLFKGLIAAAASPDEVAGVLAHEMGHVENRDVIAALLREFGIGLLIGGADGGRIVHSLLSNRFSRADERGADAFAVSALARAQISPLATAAFFDRMGKMELGMGRAATVLSYVSSHPLSADRRRLFVTSTRAKQVYAPALSAEDWRALKTICVQTRP